jgi:predicted site-specific integrase-resolvase
MSVPEQAEGWMNLTEAAAYLRVSPRTARLVVEAGTIRAEHPLSDNPWIFNEADLKAHVGAVSTGRAVRKAAVPA